MKTPPREVKLTQVFSGFEEDSGKRGRLPIILTVIVTLLLLAYGVAAWAASGKIPADTKIGGVAIGQMDAPAAAKALETALTPTISQPLTLKAGEKTAQIDPAAAGLEVDYAASVAQVAGFSLSPQAVFKNLLGYGDVPLVTTTDEKKLKAALKNAAAALQANPVEANLECENGSFRATEPAAGQSLDINQAAQVVAAKWTQSPQGIEVPVETKAPQSTAEDLKTAQEGVAKTLLSAPVKVTVGPESTTLQPAQICAATSFSFGEKGLAPKLDGAALKAAVIAQLPTAQTAPQDARFVFENGQPKLIEAVDGTELTDTDVQRKIQAAAVTTDQREAALTLTVKHPDFTTEDAQNAGIKEVIGEFGTPYPNMPARTANLVRGTQLITGILIKPNEEFSLLKALLPIDASNGYRASGVINNGFHTEAMGGGLSQVSTTTFNAAYFAGMDLVEFQPHTEYFARYPEGRESTLWDPGIDLKWKNPNPTAVLVQGWVGGGQVHVRIWGTKYYEVKSTTSPRSNIVQPKVRHSASQYCEPSSAGQPGFTVSVTRERYLEGKLHDSKTYTTTYQAQDTVVCDRLQPNPAATDTATPAPADQHD